VGAEVSESVKQIFKADNVPVEWEQVDVTGMETGDKHTEELFRESIASLKRNKLGLKGMRYHAISILIRSDIGQQVSYTLPWSVPVISLSTSHCVKSLTSTPQSS